MNALLSQRMAEMAGANAFYEIPAPNGCDYYNFIYLCESTAPNLGTHDHRGWRPKSMEKGVIGYYENKFGMLHYQGKKEIQDAGKFLLACIQERIDPREARNLPVAEEFRQAVGYRGSWCEYEPPRALIAPPDDVNQPRERKLRELFLQLRRNYQRDSSPSIVTSHVWDQRKFLELLSHCWEEAKMEDKGGNWHRWKPCFLKKGGISVGGKGGVQDRELFGEVEFKYLEPMCVIMAIAACEPNCADGIVDEDGRYIETPMIYQILQYSPLVQVKFWQPLRGMMLGLVNTQLDRIKKNMKPKSPYGEGSRTEMLPPRQHADIHREEMMSQHYGGWYQIYQEMYDRMHQQYLNGSMVFPFLKSADRPSLFA